MRNEQKAIKIVEQYETRYNDTRDLLWTDLEDIAMQAMQWKEQQMIDKATEWLKNRTMGDLCLSIDNKSLVNEFIESFKQAMMEE